MNEYCNVQVWQKINSRTHGVMLKTWVRSLQRQSCKLSHQKFALCGLEKECFFFFGVCVDHLFALVDEYCTWIVWTHYFESSVQLKKLPLVPGDFWQILCAFSLLILSMFSLLSVINFLMIKNRCLSPHLSIPSWCGNNFCGDKKLLYVYFLKLLHFQFNPWCIITNEETATGSYACNFN